jgi:ferredoxin
VKSIKLLTEYCVGSGACVLECPEVFDLDEEGLVTQIDPNPAEELWPKIRHAAAVCPVSVIDLVEA